MDWSFEKVLEMSTDPGKEDTMQNSQMPLRMHRNGKLLIQIRVERSGVHNSHSDRTLGEKASQIDIC